MEILRLNLYSQIEDLTAKLRSFDTDEYGISYDPEAVQIRAQIADLETKISETWIK